MAVARRLPVALRGGLLAVVGVAVAVDARISPQSRDHTKIAAASMHSCWSAASPCGRVTAGGLVSAASQPQ